MILFPFLRRELPEDSFIAKYFQSQGEPAIYEEPSLSNIGQIVEQAQTDPSVIAAKAAEDAAEKPFITSGDEFVDDPVDDGLDDGSGPGGPVTITSIRQYVSNGRRMRLTIYSDGTSVEEDLGPADTGGSPPAAPQLDENVGDPVEKAAKDTTVFNVPEAELYHTCPS